MYLFSSILCGLWRMGQGGFVKIDLTIPQIARHGVGFYFLSPDAIQIQNAPFPTTLSNNLINVPQTPRI